jgi:alpha-tubulin suppressor-like RCC1 family protein
MDLAVLASAASLAALSPFPWAAQAATPPLPTAAVPAQGAVLAAGPSSMCIIMHDHSVKCFGNSSALSGNALCAGAVTSVNVSGLASSAAVAAPGSVGTMKAFQVTVGRAHMCILNDERQVYCCGEPDRGQLGTGSAVLAYSRPTTAVGLGAGRRATQVSAGADHTVALLDDGTLLAWGANTYGQLGLGHTSDIGDDEAVYPAGAVDLGAGRIAVQVAAGGRHTCVVLGAAAAGSVLCWGGSPATGSGSTALITTPSSAAVVALGAGRTAVQVTAGDQHTCVLLASGDIMCFGGGSAGALGYGSTANVGDVAAPSAAGLVNMGVGRRAVFVAAGTGTTCAIMDAGLASAVAGQLLCWGANGAGQLAIGSTTAVGVSNTPGTSSFADVGVPAASKVLDVATAGNTTCIITAERILHCCGAVVGATGVVNRCNSGAAAQHGPIDLGTPFRTLVPRVVSAALGLDSAPLLPAQVTGGLQFTCVVADTPDGPGRVLCFGDNSWGQLINGVNTATYPALPPANWPNGALVTTPGGRSALAVAAGDYHLCVLLDTRAMACGGRNDQSQAGGTATTAASFTLRIANVGSGRTVLSMASAMTHSCALRDDRKLA